MIVEVTENIPYCIKQYFFPFLFGFFGSWVEYFWMGVSGVAIKNYILCQFKKFRKNSA